MDGFRNKTFRKIRNTWKLNNTPLNDQGVNMK